MDEGEGTYDHDLALKKQSSSPKDLSYLPEAVAPPPLLASDQRVQGRPSGRRNRREEGKNQDLLSNLKLPFPWKLYQLLEEVGSSLAHIVSWMGDNNFRVHDPEAFVAHVMPKFFRMSKYQSFTRQCKCCQQKTKRRRRHPLIKRSCPLTTVYFSVHLWIFQDRRRAIPRGLFSSRFCQGQERPLLDDRSQQERRSKTQVICFPKGASDPTRSTVRRRRTRTGRYRGSFDADGGLLTVIRFTSCGASYGSIDASTSTHRGCQSTVSSSIVQNSRRAVR